MRYVNGIGLLRLKRIVRSYILAILLAISFNSYSQSRIDSFLSRIDPQKYASAVKKKAEKLEEQLVSKSLKMLEKLQKEETKVYERLLNTKDSVFAKSKLPEIKSKYADLKEKLKNPQLSKVKQYIPQLDSLSTSLKFLDENGVGGKVKDALASAGTLQSKFNQAEEIKQFIRERREQLKQQLEKLGMVKPLKQINKQVYYYAQQVNEYKEILKDPKKIEKKALELLSKTKWFQDFFKKNSMLASLFRMPSPEEYAASLPGLQTRAQVNNLIREQISSGGPNATQIFRESIGAAQSQLQELKSKVVKLGGSSTEDILPEGFKVNSQKTKSFLKRLEYGTNIQAQKGNGWWPNSADIALSVGYKLNDRSIIGLGSSYKLGIGRGLNAIRFTSEGVGLRSYIDWKIKGSFWLSGGFEMNYRSAFSTVDQLRTLESWQKSGLIGVSKKINLQTKFFKNTKLMLLWDFLSYQQVPSTQALIFRIGYTLK